MLFRSEKRRKKRMLERVSKLQNRAVMYYVIRGA